MDQAQPVLSDLDRQKATLEDKFPGWKIWYVPHSTGGVTWCAQPKPLLNCRSAEDLAEEMTAAMTEDAWPETRPASIRPAQDTGPV